jgi:hypothetical protein
MPCLPIQVVMRPQNPDKPTDFEMAALYFLWSKDTAGATIESLRRFVAIGPDVTDDLIIRFLNRGWISLDLQPFRVRITDAAQDALRAKEAAENENNRNCHGRSLSSTEDGKVFSLCFDLIGGGFAAVPKYQLTRAMESRSAVPRAMKADSPYGQPLDGFLKSPSDPGFEAHQAAIARALIQDYEARSYFLQTSTFAPPYLQVVEPGKPLTLDDVRFYRCEFKATALPQTEDQEEAEERPPPLRLKCVRGRLRQALALGQRNTEDVLRLAIEAAERQEGRDERFFKYLNQNVSEAAAGRVTSGTPIDQLGELLEERLDRNRYEDVVEAVDEVTRWVGDIGSGTINFDKSEVMVEPDALDTIKAIASKAERYVAMSAPKAIYKSTAIENATTGLLAGLAYARSDKLLSMHVVDGPTLKGAYVSDEDAIRVMYGMLNDRLNTYAPQTLHLRTPLMIADGREIVLFSASPLDIHVLRGLRIRLASAGGRRQLERISDRMPKELRDVVLSDCDSADPLIAGLPPQVIATLDDLKETVLVGLKPEVARSNGRTDPQDESALDREHAAREDAQKHLAFLNEWLETQSETVEALSGTEIHDRFWSIVQGTPIDEALVFGIAGSIDRRSLLDLEEELGARLSRQDTRDAIAPGEMLLVLPETSEFNEAARRFQRLFQGVEDRCQILRQSYDAEKHSRVSFVLNQHAALLAHDGMLSYQTTAGRSLKGVHVGLSFRGGNARGLSSRFVIKEWPVVASKLSDFVFRPKAKPAEPRHLSRNRTERLLRLWRGSDWHVDGNRGATAASSAYKEGEFGASSWPALLNDAVFLAGGTNEECALSYALTKAAAIHERENGESFGACTALARAALAESNFASVILLADALEAGSELCKPLPTFLALCLTKRQPPSNLVVADYESLQEPSETVKLLSCLLMLDGLGGQLLAWLKEIPGADALTTFTRLIADGDEESGDRVYDLGHAIHASTDAAESAQEAWSKLQALAKQESNRSLTGIGRDNAPGKLVVSCFRTDGTFLGDLFKLVMRGEVGELPDDFSALRRLLNGVRGDLGIDLLEAGGSQGQTLNSTKLADQYLDRKNAEMARQEQLPLVHLSKMPFFRTTTRKAFEIVIRYLVPYILSRSDEADQALAEAARRLYDRMDEPSGDGVPADVAWLRGRLRQRIAETGANLALESNYWLVPLEPALTFPSTAKERAKHVESLKEAFFQMEFAPGTGFANVVHWLFSHDSVNQKDRLLKEDRTARDAAPPLETLSTLIEMSKRAFPEMDLGDTEVRLRQHLASVLADFAAHATTALDVVAEVRRIWKYPMTGSAAASQLVIDSATELEAGAVTLQASVSEASEYLEQDTVMAIISTSDLRLAGGVAESMGKAWKAVGDAISGTFAQDIEAYPGSALPEKAGVSELRRLTHLSKLARPLGDVSIALDEQLKVFVTQDPAKEADSQIAARGLYKLIGEAIQGDRRQVQDVLRHHEASAIAGAIAEFLSDLPEFRLLPIASRRDGHWAVQFTHPSLTALSFGEADGLEVLIPYDYLGSYSIAALPAWKAKTFRFAIGLFYIPRDSAVPWLGWRDLIAVSKEPAASRRLRVANLLAKQRFETAELRSAWWAGSGDAVRKCLLKLVESEETSLDTPEQLNIRGVSQRLAKACFAMDLVTTDRNGRLELTRQGKAKIAELWSEEDPFLNAGEPLLFKLLERLLQA